MLGQIGVVDAVARYVDFFRPPEEGKLFFNQFFKHFKFLLVVAGDVDRLAEKHRLFERVVFLFAECAVLHDEVFAGHGWLSVRFVWFGLGKRSSETGGNGFQTAFTVLQVGLQTQLLVCVFLSCWVKTQAACLRRPFYS